LIIGADAQCRVCSIAFDTVVVLGRDGAIRQGLGVVWGAWAVSAQGYFVHGANPGQIARFDSTGALVAVSGGRGAGPGEFSRIGALQLGPGDSIWVQDLSTRRLSLFTPRGERFARAVQVPRAYSSWLVLSNGDVLLGVPQTTPRDSDRTAFLLSANNGNIRAIGPRRPNRNEGNAAAGLTLARSRQADRNWVVQRNSDIVELWDLSGTVRTLLQLPKELHLGSAADELAQRKANIAALREDAAGRLWLWIERPNPAFVAPRGELSISDLIALSSSTNAASLWDIVVIDIRRRQIAFMRTDANTFLPLGDSLFVRPEDSGMEKLLTVYRAELRGGDTASTATQAVARDRHRSQSEEWR
jgi:hypothetical protein